MGEYAVYTGEKVFIGYIWASNPNVAKHQAKLKFDLIGEPIVFLCYD